MEELHSLFNGMFTLFSLTSRIQDNKRNTLRIALKTGKIFSINSTCRQRSKKMIHSKINSEIVMREHGHVNPCIALNGDRNA